MKETTIAFQHYSQTTKKRKKKNNKTQTLTSRGSQIRSASPSIPWLQHIQELGKSTFHSSREEGKKRKRILFDLEVLMHDSNKQQNRNENIISTRTTLKFSVA